MVSPGDALPHRAHEEDCPLNARTPRTGPQLFPRSEVALQRRRRRAEQQSQSHYEKILWISYLPLPRTRALSLTWQTTGTGVNPRFFLTNRSFVVGKGIIGQADTRIPIPEGRVGGGLGGDRHETSGREGGIDQVIHQVPGLADHSGGRISQAGGYGQFIRRFPLVFDVKAVDPVPIVFVGVGGEILGVGNLSLHLSDGSLLEVGQAGESPVSADNERSPRVFTLTGRVAASFDGMRAMGPYDVVPIGKPVGHEIKRKRGAGAKGRKAGEGCDRTILASRGRSEKLERMR